MVPVHGPNAVYDPDSTAIALGNEFWRNRLAKRAPCVGGIRVLAEVGGPRKAIVNAHVMRTWNTCSFTVADCIDVFLSSNNVMVIKIIVQVQGEKAPYILILILIQAIIWSQVHSTNHWRTLKDRFKFLQNKP